MKTKLNVEVTIVITREEEGFAWIIRDGAGNDVAYSDECYDCLADAMEAAANAENWV